MCLIFVMKYGFCLFHKHANSLAFLWAPLFEQRVQKCFHYEMYHRREEEQLEGETKLAAGWEGGSWKRDQGKILP